MPYLTLTPSTSLNHAFITFGSSCRALWLSYDRDQRVLTSGVRLINLSTQLMPTGGFPLCERSELAIVRIISFVGGNPRVSRSIIRSTSACSSKRVKFFNGGGLSRRAVVPLRLRLSVLRSTLYSPAAARSVRFGSCSI